MFLTRGPSSRVAALAIAASGVAAPFAQAQTFAINTAPTTSTVLAGGSVSFTAIEVGSASFSGQVKLSVSNLPANATAAFTPSTVTGGVWGVSVLKVTTTAATPAGTYPLTISATSGGTTHTTTAQLDVRKSFSFTHPGILSGSTQLNWMAAQVNAGLSPWYGAYVTASASALGSQVYTPQPLVTVDTGATNSLVADSQAAYTQAVLWYITRNSVYADNAIKIMNAWASTMTGGITGSNARPVAVWTGDVWPRAAEIIRASYLDANGASIWGTTGIAAFQNFLNTQYVPTVAAGFPYGNYGGNLHASAAAAAMNIGVFNDDASTFFKGVDMWRTALPAYIYMTADGSNPVPPVNWTAANSTTAKLLTLWYGQSADRNGLTEETCRDLGHVHWGLAALANGAETAYQQGFNLYAESTLGTANATRMQQGLEFNSTYQNGAVVPSTLCSGAIAMGSSVVTGELAYNALVNRWSLSLPQLEAYLSARRPTGASYFMDWETLTHYGQPLVSRRAKGL